MIELQEGGRAVIVFGNDAQERKILYDEIAKGLKSKETHHMYLKAVQECQTLLSTVLEDASSDKEDLILSALNVLGLCMFIKSLSRAILPEKARSVLAVLCDLLEVNKEQRRNAIYTRVLWCLSTQQLPLAVWKESVPNVLSQVTTLLAYPNSISTSVDAEGLNVVKRCNEVAPEVFEPRQLMILYKGLIRILTSKSFRNYTLAQSLLEQFSSASPKTLRKVLLNDLSQGRLTAMIQLYSDKAHSRHQLSMLHSWSLFVQHLGQALNSASNNKFLNEMLKIVEMGFTAPVGQVQEAAYRGWTVLIEAFSNNPGLMESKKRMKLLMTPFVSLHSKLNDPVVCLARISSWWVLIKLALREQKQLKTSHMEDIVIPFLLSCMGLRPSATKSILEEAASVSLPQSSSDLNEGTALYCSPGSMSPEIPDMSSQSTALGTKGQFFTPHSSAPPVDTSLACSTESGTHCRTPSTLPPTSSPPPTPSSAPPPLLKVGRSNNISTCASLSSQSAPISLSHLDEDCHESSLLLSDMCDVFPECLLCALQVLLGLLGEPGTALEGSAVALDTEQPLWLYSDWLMTTYPGLMFGIAERALNALEHVDTPQLRSAIVMVWKGLTVRVAKTWKGEVQEEDKERFVFCSHKLLCLLSKAADSAHLPGSDFGTMLEAFHLCVSHFSHQDVYQEYLFSGKWQITSSVDKQIQVYPVHFLLELLLRPKFVHLSEGGGPWFDYVWDIVAGAMNSPALLENREKVFTGIVSLARALPPSVYQLVEKFLADRGVEADSQEESQNDSQEEPNKALQEDSDTDTQLDSQKDSCKVSEETSLEDSHKIAQKDVQEECVVMEAVGEEEEEAELCSVSEADKREEKELKSNGDEEVENEILNTPLVTGDAVLMSSISLVIPESDLSPATPIHGSRKRSNEDLSFLPPAKQLKMAPSPEQPVRGDIDECPLPVKNDNCRQAHLPDNHQEMVDDNDSQPSSSADNCQQSLASGSNQQPTVQDSQQQLSPGDNCQQPLPSDICQQPSPSDICQQPSPGDSHQEPSPNDSHPEPSPSDSHQEPSLSENHKSLSHSDSQQLPLPSDRQQAMHSKGQASSDGAQSEHACECIGVEESPVPVKSSVIQCGTSVNRTSVHSSAPQNPQEPDNASGNTEDEKAAGGGVNKDREDPALACMHLPSNNASAPRQTALASIEKTRKRQDDSSESSRSKRSKTDTDTSMGQKRVYPTASHESVIRGPNSTGTNVAPVNSEHPLPAPVKEFVAAESVISKESKLEGAPEDTKDMAMEDQQESGALESSQLDSSQELFGTPQAVVQQEPQCHTGSNLTSADDLLEAGSAMTQTGSNLALTGSNMSEIGSNSAHVQDDALPPPETGNLAQTDGKPRSQVLPTGSNDFGKKQQLAAKKRLAAFQPVVRKSIYPRTEDKLSSEDELLPCPGTSGPSSSSSLTSVDALRRRRIAMPSPVMSRGARAVMFALTPSRSAAKGKTPSKSPTWTSPRHSKGSHNGILRVQSQFDTPVPRTPSRRVSFADPIEEQQSPGGSVTRVSGGKGGKKSLRSKVSFVQPRRLSQESNKEHSVEGETEEAESQEEEDSSGSRVPPEAMDSAAHPPEVKEGEGLALQSEYGAESMELEVPSVSLETPTSEDDTEPSEHSEELGATVCESEMQIVQKDDHPASDEPCADGANNTGSVENELNSIQESPLEEEGETNREGEETEGGEEKQEEQEEETEGEMEQHNYSVAQVVQELERPISPLATELQEVENSVSSLVPSGQEEDTAEQDSCAEPKTVVLKHDASTQTTDDSILQAVKDVDTLQITQLIDSQEALYALLGRVQRKLAERLSLDI